MSLFHRYRSSALCFRFLSCLCSPYNQFFGPGTALQDRRHQKQPHPSRDRDPRRGFPNLWCGLLGYAMQGQAYSNVSMAGIFHPSRFWRGYVELCLLLYRQNVNQNTARKHRQIKTGSGAKNQPFANRVKYGIKASPATSAWAAHRKWSSAEEFPFASTADGGKKYVMRY